MSDNAIIQGPSATDGVLTVYYDGACPLCLKEIGFLKRALPAGAAVAFLNVASEDAAEACPIDRQTLLARFHVQLPDGQLVDGAQAFTEVWSRVRLLYPLRWVGRFAPTRWLLDQAYRGFLRLRPRLQKWVSTQR